MYVCVCVFYNMAGAGYIYIYTKYSIIYTTHSFKLLSYEVVKNPSSLPCLKFVLEHEEVQFHLIPFHL